MKIKNVFCLGVLLPLLFLCAGCGNPEYTSQWKNREIIIDGNDNEWRDAPAEKDKVFIGAMNDKDNLYMCISTEDKSTKAQLLGVFGQTVTLWFSCPGKEDKKIGVRFNNENESSSRPQSTDEAFINFKSRLNNYTIVYTGEPAGPAPGNTNLEIKAGYSNERLVLELKMPLIFRSVLSPETVASKQIIFELETSEQRTAEKPRDMSAGAPQGGGMGAPGSGGGGRGGGRGGKRHSGGSSFSGHIQTTLTITLSDELKSADSPATSVPTDSVTINLPGIRGGLTTVLLKKVQGGFTGPQGEFYSNLPSVEQLKVMYGNKND